MPQAVEACTYEYIRQRTSERPDGEAICSWDGSFTYAELAQQSARVARFLVSHVHCRPEVLVPLCFHKSKWAVVAMLGTIQAGGAFVILSPFDPPKRLQAIIEDLGARFILSSPETSALFDGIVDTVYNVPLELPLATIAQIELPTIQPRNMAYVLYTSGSTGKPKGVIIEHRALSTSVRYLGEAFGYSTATRTLQFAAYTFDVAILDILFTLSYGGCVCIPSEDERADIVTIISRLNVNFAVLTPSIARTISPNEVKPLETLALGGEALGQRDVVQWAGKLRLINGYGPTECTIAVVYNDVTGRESRADTIGHAVACTTWVVEAEDHDVLAPDGSVGELVIQGPTLARGYLNSPEKTAQAFVYPKWLVGASAKDSCRVYKTGDLVRYDVDGIIYLGRKGTQVKLNGQRVELGEIENHLWSHPLIENALVLFADIHPRTKGLIAVFSLRDDLISSTDRSSLSLMKGNEGSIEKYTEEIRGELSARLPGYMIPAIWLAVCGIPLLSSGKIDRNTVTQWYANLGDEVHVFNASRPVDLEPQYPENSTHRMIKKIVAQVLFSDDVQINQSFASLGGDSIAAMAVQSRCRNEGILIRYQDVVKAGSIGEIAQGAKLDSSSSEHTEADVEGAFNLSPVQQMYIEQPKLPTRFHSSFYLRFTETLDTSMVALAVEGIVRRHSMLRARFSRVAQGWQQSLIKDVSSSYEFHTHQLEEMQQIRRVVATKHATLDIIKGPVFLVDMFITKSSAATLFMVAHHLVIDLVSWQIILHDLETLLRSRRLPDRSPFPFPKWCELQAQQSQNTNPSEVLPVDIPPARLDYWGTIPSNDFKDVLQQQFELDMKQTEGLIMYCRRHLHVKPVDVLVAAAIYSFEQVFPDRTSPTFYCENHGRESWCRDVDISGTVGWFNTLVPIKIGSEWAVTFPETIEEVCRIREQIPGNGQPYFAYRCLHPKGREAFSEHANMEVFFNYTGYQQLGRGSTLFHPERLGDGEDVADIGLDTGRLALLDVLVDMNNGCFQYTVLYNRYMKHQEKIWKWVDECQRVLVHWLQDRY